jgi:hypothetical protein
MFKYITKFAIEAILSIVIIIFSVSFCLVLGCPEHWKFLLAHSTGVIVQISLILTLIYRINRFKCKFYNKYSIYSIIFCGLGFLLMLLGYNLFLFEYLSPYVHAPTNLIFDSATIFSVISIGIDEIAYKKYMELL